MGNRHYAIQATSKCRASGTIKGDWAGAPSNVPFLLFR
jgi:hypothetical protein